jgi:hypothetical protein
MFVMFFIFINKKRVAVGYPLMLINPKRFVAFWLLGSTLVERT